MRASCLAAALALALAAGPATARAASVSITRDALTFDAAPGERNAVTVTRAPASYRIVDTGAIVSPGGGCRSTAPNAVECTTRSVERIVVRAGDGDDFVTLSVTTRSIMSGGDGDDRLEGGEGLDDLLGGDGDDELLGGDSADLFIGGTGADTMSGGASIIELLELDTVVYDERTRPVNVSLDGVANDGAGGERDNVLRDVEAVIGGHAGDLLTGDDRGIDVLLGGRGDDALRGLGGDLDALIGEAGADRIAGGPGFDGAIGGRGRDLVVGGGEPDFLEGGLGPDDVRGGGARDDVYGGPGRDRISGGPGPDRLFAADGMRDAVVGGPGRDRAQVDCPLDVVIGVERHRCRGVGAAALTGRRGVAPAGARARVRDALMRASPGPPS
jgi:RTX calcium-binding nonapeptide repeat (4 copies)